MQSMNIGWPTYWPQMLSKHLNVMKSRTGPACPVTPVCITFCAIALLLCLKDIFLFRTYIKY